MDTLDKGLGIGVTRITGCDFLVNDPVAQDFLKLFNLPEN